MHCSYTAACEEKLCKSPGTFPKIPPVPAGLVQIRFSDAKTIKVQLSGEMTDFKLTGDLCLQGKPERLSLE